jgi:hypothetical protein
MSVRLVKVYPHIMWRLKFRDFAKDFVRPNLDDKKESLSLYKLKGD